MTDHIKLDIPNIPNYLNENLRWFDQNPATYLTDYLFCISQLAMFFYLRNNIKNISSKNNPNYFQQKTILWFVSVYNLWLGLGFGIGGVYHNIFDMTKGPVLSNEIYWKASMFSGILACPFAMMIPVLQVVRFEKSTLKTVKIVSFVVALMFAIEEAWLEMVGFSIAILILIAWLCLASLGIKIGIKFFGVQSVGSVNPSFLWAGAFSLIGYLLFYNGIKPGCDNWNAYPENCPFPAWFNHNAVLHILFIPAYWSMAIAWLPGTDYKLAQLNTEL